MPISFRHLLWVALIALLGGVVAYKAGSLQAGREMTQQRADALLALTAHRARLESVLNSALHITGGLASLIAVEGEPDEERFRLLAQNLLGLDPYVRNIALAPANVIRMIYPLQGNEQALGLSYPEHAEQWPAVRHAIETRHPVVVGPLELRQGGMGIINRIPVFLNRGPRQGEYWGVVSSVIDFDTLLRASGLEGEASAYEFALRGLDGQGAEGLVFWGNPALFEASPLALEVRLTDGTWFLAIQPKDGWYKPRAWQTEAFVLGILLTMLIAGLVLLLLSKQRSISHLAMHDPLTGLLNRRAFDQHLREASARQLRHGGSLAVLHLDLDGFKPINDRLGHAAGDQALCMLAERMQAMLRGDDVVARFGGDEFVILLQGMEPSSLRMAERVADKMLEAINLPMQINGQQVHCGVSIGIACCPEHVCDEGSLMRYADQAMYAAKAEGKGRWCVWREEYDEMY
ncbi:MAG: diguanylate cyclase [Pseudomonadota bacterium]